MGETDWREIREAVSRMQAIEAEYRARRSEASEQLARAYEAALERGLPEDEVHRAIGEAFFPGAKDEDEIEIPDG